MECFGNRTYNSQSDLLAELLAGKRTLKAPDPELYRRVLANWDSVAKPLDGLGRFERITAQIGAILGTDDIDISRKAVLILCADNGIVAEGISQSGQEVTAAVAEEMGRKLSSVCKMARQVGADTIPVDIGINCGEPIAGVLDKKIRRGTRNFRLEPAMTHEEALGAIQEGMELVADCREQGYRILATGEMGIGNTTTSSAVAAALLGVRAEEVTGRGAGLPDQGLMRKQAVIQEAVDKYGLYQADPLRVLETVGGLDIAGLAGVCIGGAVHRIPIVLDGVISMAAALLAQRLVPGTVQYLIGSHQGREPAVERLTQALGLAPVIHGELALGEGTGAVMMMALLDIALSVYVKRTLFSDIRIQPYERFV
ncbi:MAG: nicotinate-nucleotide--dimethylbenzimidazole phosphoribosyltransferase [Lachnospiraceae bacterium]|nr:nicotinate-nucleotide--dimethylbenzimidazole phosphoribosyltransferase [Lachnospiraceae bacterium]